MFTTTRFKYQDDCKRIIEQTPQNTAIFQTSYPYKKLNKNSGYSNWAWNMDKKNYAQVNNRLIQCIIKIWLTCFLIWHLFERWYFFVARLYPEFDPDIPKVLSNVYDTINYSHSVQGNTAQYSMAYLASKAQQLLSSIRKKILSTG